MKEKKKMRQKKRSEKKVPMRESNPLNLQPAVTTTKLPPQGLIARTILTYMANLNGHELRVASLAALAPPIIPVHACNTLANILIRGLIHGRGVDWVSSHPLSLNVKGQY